MMARTYWIVDANTTLVATTEEMAEAFRAAGCKEISEGAFRKIREETIDLILAGADAGFTEFNAEYAKALNEARAKRGVSLDWSNKPEVSR